MHKGNIAEEIACRFLQRHGFLIVDRNYLKKWGELDIVASKGEMLHFVEVKSAFLANLGSATRYSPEENVHGLKIRRLRRTIETYLSEKGGGLGREFQFHVLCVYGTPAKNEWRVKWMKNIIL